MKLTKEKLVEVVKNINQKLIKKSEYLSSLDQKIGDGDHGTNMQRGFNEISKTNLEKKTIPEIFEHIGETLLNTVGGASGPLYGMGFISASNALEHKEYLDRFDFLKLVQNMCANLAELGEVELNEKTMFDVWKNLELLLIQKKEQWDNLWILQIINKTKSFMNNTKEMIATKGRASYLQERSKGVVDPGAVSSFYILEEILLGFKND